MMTVNELKKSFNKTERIKKGGQKIVYRAYKGSECFALKIILDSCDQRVKQEIDVVESLKLSNVPSIIEHGFVLDESINEMVLYIIEQYIDGESLRDFINSGKKFNLTQAFNVLHTLIDIEVQLEKSNILHRDINPNNIILSSNGAVYLIDFGLAKILNGSSLTRTTATLGPHTPGYAPYEQFANRKNDQDVRTDLFQIGVTIYEACTGKNPFVGKDDSYAQILHNTTFFTPLLLTLEGDKRGMFSQFINMLMAKSQLQRPDSAADAMRYFNMVKDNLELEGH